MCDLYCCLLPQCEVLCLLFRLSDCGTTLKMSEVTNGPQVPLYDHFWPSAKSYGHTWCKDWFFLRLHLRKKCNTAPTYI